MTNHIANLKPGPVNLDEMDSAELYTFMALTRGSGRYRVAEQMFKRKKLAAATVQRLQDYAYAKVTAIACRKRGELRTALHYESICFCIYCDLPEYARWEL